MTETKDSEEDSDYSFSDDVYDEKFTTKMKKINLIPDINIQKKILILGSRKISRLHKKLILDLERLLPHLTKEKKIERKHQFKQLCSLMNFNRCQWTIYVEATRKNMDRSAVAMWFCKPDGLRIKCLMQYLHTS